MKREPNADEQRILNEEPEVDYGMGLCLSAMRELESCRAPGPMHAGPIPWTAIRDWCTAEGLDQHWRRLLVEVLHHQDVKRADRIRSELSNNNGKAPTS